MQKKVIAAVIGGLLVAPAAFADVKISGRLSTGLENYKLSAGNAAAPAASYSNERRISDQSSSFIFSGSEDLGGGMSAWFKIDNRFSFPDGGSGVASLNQAAGNTMLGLSGSFGKVGIGRSDLYYNEMAFMDANASSPLQAFLSDGLVSQVNGTSIASGTRTPNVIKWDGKFGGGVTASFAYSTAGNNFAATEGSGRGADGSKGDTYFGALRWSSGPLRMGAALWTSEPEGAGSNKAGEQKGTRVWAHYKFGMVQVGLGYDSSKLRVAAGEGETKRNAILLPIRFVSGANTFQLTYATADDLSGPNGGATTTNTGAKALSVGWNHALSRATHVGIYYTKLDNDANATYQLFARSLSGTAAAAGESAAQLYFGIAHFY